MAATHELLHSYPNEKKSEGFEEPMYFASMKETPIRAANCCCNDANEMPAQRAYSPIGIEFVEALWRM